MVTSWNGGIVMARTRSGASCFCNCGVGSVKDPVVCVSGVDLSFKFWYKLGFPICYCQTRSMLNFCRRE